MHNTCEEAHTSSTTTPNPREKRLSSPGCKLLSCQLVSRDYYYSISPKIFLVRHRNTFGRFGVYRNFICCNWCRRATCDGGAIVFVAEIVGSTRGEKNPKRRGMPSLASTMAGKHTSHCRCALGRWCTGVGLNFKTDRKVTGS